MRRGIPLPRISVVTLGGGSPQGQEDPPRKPPCYSVITELTSDQAAESKGVQRAPRMPTQPVGACWVGDGGPERFRGSPEATQ